MTSNASSRLPALGSADQRAEGPDDLLDEGREVARLVLGRDDDRERRPGEADPRPGHRPSRGPHRGTGRWPRSRRIVDVIEPSLLFAHLAASPSSSKFVPRRPGICPEISPRAHPNRASLTTTTPPSWTGPLAPCYPGQPDWIESGRSRGPFTDDVIATRLPSTIESIAVDQISPDPFSISIYGETAAELDDLIDGIRVHGVLVPLGRHAFRPTFGRSSRVTAAWLVPGLSVSMRSPARSAQSRTRISPTTRGPRIQPSAAQDVQPDDARGRRLRRAGQLATGAQRRSQVNLRKGSPNLPIVGIPTVGPVGPMPPLPGPSASAARTSTARPARSGGKPRSGDARAKNGVAQIDAGTKTIHAAYKDLRRRDRFTAGFRPTPYDVWSFKHDRAFGIPHPRLDPPRHRRPRPPLLHRARRLGRRPHGRRRHDPRRLRIDGTPMPGV